MTELNIRPRPGANSSGASAAEDILRISQAQDRDCFQRLFLNFAPRVKAYFSHRGMSPEAAEDLAQETLINVWRKAAMFDPSKASAAAWIFTIARNLRIDALRKDLHPLRLMDGLGDGLVGPKTPEDVYVGQEEGTEIRKALSRLPVEQLEVLKMSYFMERPHSDIADELHLPLGTVKSRLRLALAHLRTIVPPR